MDHKQRDKIFFFAFVIVWVAIVIWNLLTPPKAFSESENRYLKSWPDFTMDRLLDGDFMDDVNVFLNDQFAGRPYWVSMQSVLEYTLGKREVNSVFLGKKALLSNNLQPDDDVTQKNIDGIRAFAERYQMPVYLMLTPTATHIQAQNLPAFASGWDEGGYIAAVNQQLADSVIPIDIVDVLKENHDSYIYYRTDHHWTAQGAYLAYSTLADSMGIRPKSRDVLSHTVVNDAFYGTFHSKTGFPLIPGDIIEKYETGAAVSYTVFDGIEEKEYSSIYFDEFLDQKDKYSYFLGQVQPYATIKTQAGVGRSIIIFKDSYAHSLVPMLLSDFDEIKLVDLRFINAVDFEEMLGISTYDCALFLYSTDIFSQQAGTAKLTQDTSILP